MTMSSLRLLHTNARTAISLHPAHTPTKQVRSVSVPVLTFLDHFEHALHGLLPRPRQLELPQRLAQLRHPAQRTSGIQRLQSQAVLREVQRELLFFLPRSVVDHVAAQTQVETRQRPPHSFPADDRDRRSTANSIRTNKLTSTFTC